MWSRIRNGRFWIRRIRLLGSGRFWFGRNLRSCSVAAGTLASPATDIKVGSGRWYRPLRIPAIGRIHPTALPFGMLLLGETDGVSGEVEGLALDRKVRATSGAITDFEWADIVDTVGFIGLTLDPDRLCIPVFPAEFMWIEFACIELTASVKEACWPGKCDPRAGSGWIPNGCEREAAADSRTSVDASEGEDID